MKERKEWIIQKNSIEKIFRIIEDLSTREDSSTFEVHIKVDDELITISKDEFSQINSLYSQEQDLDNRLEYISIYKKEKAIITYDFYSEFIQISGNDEFLNNIYKEFQ